VLSRQCNELTLRLFELTELIELFYKTVIFLVHVL